MMSAEKDYGVEVLVAYENKRVGQVIYPNGVERQMLIRCGRVRALSVPKEDKPAKKPTLTLRRS